MRIARRQWYPRRMDTPLFIFAALVAIGIGTVAVFVARAPAGYQDETGFHLGSGSDRDSDAD